MDAVLKNAASFKQEGSTLSSLKVRLKKARAVGDAALYGGICVYRRKTRPCRPLQRGAEGKEFRDRCNFECRLILHAPDWKG
jgi:hypothetical protein